MLLKVLPVDWMHIKFWSIMGLFALHNCCISSSLIKIIKSLSHLPIMSLSVYWMNIVGNFDQIQCPFHLIRQSFNFFNLLNELSFFRVLITWFFNVHKNIFWFSVRGFVRVYIITQIYFVMYFIFLDLKDYKSATLFIILCILYFWI